MNPAPTTPLAVVVEALRGTVWAAAHEGVSQEMYERHARALLAKLAETNDEVYQRGYAEGWKHARTGRIDPDPIGSAAHNWATTHAAALSPRQHTEKMLAEHPERAGALERARERLHAMASPAPGPAGAEADYVRIPRDVAETAASVLQTECFDHEADIITRALEQPR